MFEKKNIPFIVAAILLVLAAAVLIYQKTQGPRGGMAQIDLGSIDVPAAQPHIAPLMYSDRSLKIGVTICETRVYAILDTGSDKLVVNTKACVATGPAQQKVYAEGPVTVHPAQKALGVSLRPHYKVNVPKVDFASSGDSILGLSHYSPVTQSFSIVFDGHSGGWFTLNPPTSDRGIVLSYTVTQGGFYSLPVMVQVGKNKMKKLNAIIDTGSTDNFVDGQLLKPGVGFKVFTPDGKQQLADFEGDEVLISEGGETFKKMLHSLNGFLLGLPFFATRNITFNRAQKTISIEQLREIKK